MKTKELKRNEGITLIALVITIIVLLILAGVTIATLTGENGILTRATEADEQTEKKGLKEEIELALGSDNIGDQVDGSGNLEEELNRINGATVSKVAEDAYYVERDGNGYTVYEDGTIEEGKVDVWDGTTVEKPEVDEQGNWHIYTTGQMKFFADYSNDVLTEEEKTEANMPEITETTTVYLENNLDMGARQEDGVLTTATETQWTPVKFAEGTFDGKEHSISGIYANTEGASGLFERLVSYAKVQNITIKNSYIEGEADMELIDAYGIGGIAGFAGTDVINCHNINTTVVSRGGLAGGIIGTSSAINIRQCSNSGEVIAQTSTCVGGIIANLGILGGTTGYEIEDCINTGKIQGENYAGGICGTTGATIKGGRNTGTIIGQMDTGGIAGYASTAENSTNEGEISGTQNTGRNNWCW